MKKNFTIPEKILSNSNLSPLARLIYCYLFTVAKENKTTVSNKSLLEYFSVTERTISRGISELKNNGLITVELEHIENGTIRHITLINKVYEVEEQIKQMKCCGNCKYLLKTHTTDMICGTEYSCRKGGFSSGLCEEWELKLNKTTRF